jgi:hypothetical protein
MKKIFAALLLILSFAPFVSAQTPFTAPWGFNYSAPTGAPSALGTRVRFDITTGRIYTWSPDALNWQLQGYAIDQISGTSAPAYAPVRGQSWFAVNGDTLPRLYQYTGTGTIWKCLNCSDGKTYTAGTGITLSGPNLTVINNAGDLSNTNELNTGFDISGGNLRIIDAGATRTVPVTTIAPDQSVTNELQTIDTFSVSGSIVSLSLSGDAQPAKTITLPASGITSLTGDVTASGPGSVAATIANGAVNGAKLASGAVSDSTKVGANVIEQSNIDNGAVWARHLARMGASTGQVLGWNGSVWGPTAAGSGWGLTGNAATAGSSFLGTTNNTSLRFRTNNVQRMILDSLGNLQVSAYIKYDGTVLARDNRDNSLWTQSASSVASNRDMQIGNGTYSTLRFVIRGIGFGSSVATSDLVSNWFFASGFTSTGTNGLAFKIVGQNAAAGNFNGGSILLDGGAKSGTGSDGNIILGSITGSVGVGTASPAARLHVQGAGATSANTALLVQNSTPSDLLTVRNDGKVSFWATNTATGTTGARTIDRPSGTVNFAAGASTLVVANSLVTTASIVFAVVRTNDTTATIKNVVPAAGSFTITLTANATAETSVGFFVIN